jgi:hypothetical protein
LWPAPISWSALERDEVARNLFVVGDLREEIVAAIQETGFIQKNDKGEPVGTGEGGCKGFIKT